ncbi:hypothetical protein SEPCBS57363_002289 [Sporothrix epigloea]|uniref:CCHC-type domain-containing protein n=1 Tax=Sporothrix epigloea TaxID=1892477 RepID=A0ABP0DF28_9PEZI
MELGTSHVDDTQRRKFTGKCYNCGKVGHYARDCRSRVPETNDKNESGWFPRAPKTKNVKQMRHSFAHNSKDYGSEPEEHTTSLTSQQAPALDKYTQDTQDDSGNGGVRLPQGADLD